MQLEIEYEEFESAGFIRANQIHGDYESCEARGTGEDWTNTVIDFIAGAQWMLELINKKLD